VSAQSVRQVVASEVDDGDGLESTYLFDEYSRLHDRYLNDRTARVLDDLAALYLTDAVLRVGEKSITGRDNIKKDLEEYLATLLVRQRRGRTYREIRSTVQVAVASETEVVYLVETTGYHYRNTVLFARSSRYDVVAIEKQDGKWGLAVEVLGAVEPKSLSSESGGLTEIADATLVNMYRQFNRPNLQTDPR
jgi:hypothetical protein